MPISFRINTPRIVNRGREISNTMKAILVLLAVCTSCGQSAGTTQVQRSKSTISNTSEAGHNKYATQNASLLCDRISEIKTLPVKNEKVDDPAYNDLLEAGEAVIPCLIEKITETTEIPDPSGGPRFPDTDTKTGDVAYFVLIRIAKLNFVELLPDDVQQEFKEEGMYAYFEFIKGQGGRQRLQSKLYDWYYQKYGKDMRKQGKMHSNSYLTSQER